MAVAAAVDEPSMVPPGRAVELPGRGTTFVREVAGPPGAPTLVLLHGLGATGGLNWLWCFQLGRRYRVVALDQRGHGRGIPTRRFRLADCADDVAALADVLGVERVVPVGYSMGGPVAQLVWHRHRHRVAGLVLCATSGFFVGSPREQVMFGMVPAMTLFARTTPLAARRALVQRVLAARLGDVAARQWVLDELARSDPAAVAEAAGALGRFSSRRWIGEIDVPTAVVVTERDGLVAPARQRQLAASIAGATVHPVAADHAACVSQPKRFVPALAAACHAVTSAAARAAPLSAPPG